MAEGRRRELRLRGGALVTLSISGAAAEACAQATTPVELPPIEVRDTTPRSDLSREPTDGCSREANSTNEYRLPAYTRVDVGADYELVRASRLSSASRTCSARPTTPPPRIRARARTKWASATGGWCRSGCAGCSEAGRHSGGGRVPPFLPDRWVGLVMAGFPPVAGLTGSPLAFGAELDMAVNDQPCFCGRR